jgi:hypothetical protein
MPRQTVAIAARVVALALLGMAIVMVRFAPTKEKK